MLDGVTFTQVLQVLILLGVGGIGIKVFKLGGFFALAEKHFADEVLIHKEIKQDVAETKKCISKINEILIRHDERIEGLRRYQHYRNSIGTRDPEDDDA